MGQGKNNFLSSLLKNDAVKMIGALAIVGIFSGVSLVFIYSYATPRIEKNIQEETARAIEKIFPAASGIEKIENSDIFRVSDKNGKLYGYAFVAESNGYQGTIRMIAGVDTDIVNLQGIEILESQETPGLGAEIANDPFKKQFKGLKVNVPIEYVKNEVPDKDNEIQAITGATISSRAVVKALNDSIAAIREQIK